MVLDPGVFGKPGQADEASFLECSESLQLQQVVVDGHSGFDDLLIGQDLPEFGGKADMVQLEDVDLFGSGQLEKRRQVVLAFFEVWFGLGVEAQQCLFAQFSNGFVEGVFFSDQLDFSVIAVDRQGVYLLFGHAAIKTESLIWLDLGMKHFLSFARIVEVAVPAENIGRGWQDTVVARCDNSSQYGQKMLLHISVPVVLFVVFFNRFMLKCSVVKVKQLIRLVRPVFGENIQI